MFLSYVKTAFYAVEVIEVSSNAPNVYEMSSRKVGRRLVAEKKITTGVERSLKDLHNKSTACQREKIEIHPHESG